LSKRRGGKETKPKTQEKKRKNTLHKHMTTQQKDPFKVNELRDKWECGDVKIWYRQGKNTVNSKFWVAQGFKKARKDNKNQNLKHRAQKSNGVGLGERGAKKKPKNESPLLRKKKLPSATY